MWSSQIPSTRRRYFTDRGFNIHDSASMYCARVQLPPFTRGKKQLSKEEVDVSRQLSRVRIHVERIIGVVRQKYMIFQSTLPVNFIMCSKNQDISVIDKVVTICCAFCNCCKSVVSFEYFLYDIIHNDVVKR